MANNRTEAAPVAAATGASVTAKSAGGLQIWLPLLAALVLMPALSYVTTTYILVPKLQAVVGAAPAAGHGDAKTAGHLEPNTPKLTYPLNKVLVNVSGQHQRYLIANYTLVGTASDFKTVLESRKEQLLDLATGIMSTKTITDLEKPDIRNLIRSELMSAFNNALGGNLVKEIWITEFAIQ